MTNAGLPTRWRRWYARKYHPSWQELTVPVLAVVYAVVAAYLSIGRVLSLIAKSADLGLFLQAFWSINHGRGFFEAVNYGTSGALSLFAIHPAPVLYPLGLFYRYFPTAPALLILEAIFVASASLPLFYLTRDITHSDTRALFAAALYLVWIPVLSGNLFDFHLESLFPVEMFSLVLLWNRRSYLWAIIPAALCICTEEIGPVLVFLVAVFFLLPPFRETAARALRAWRAGTEAHRAREFLRASWRWFKFEIRQRRVLASLILAIAAAVSYGILRILETSSGLGVKGTTTLSTVPVWEYPIHTLLIHINFNPFLTDAFARLEFWGLLLALLAFLPFFAPRAFIISLPWIIFTVISKNVEYTSLGVEYGLVSAAVLFIGVAYGLDVVGRPRGGPSAATAPTTAAGPGASPQATLVRAAQAQQMLLDAWADTGVRPTPDPAEVNRRILELAELSHARPGAAATAAPAGRPRLTVSYLSNRGRRLGWQWSVILIVAIGVNIALSPVDPYIASPGVTAPGYATYTGPMPSYYPNLVKLASVIPTGSTVVATGNLFPLIANNIYAYTLGPHQVYTPFNASNLPSYVFVSNTDRGSVPGWLVTDVWNTSRYGIVGTVGTAPGGIDYLFERNFTGSPVNYNAPLINNGTIYAPGQVSAEGNGQIRADPNATFGYGVYSIENSTGNVWSGTNPQVPAGVTNITIFLALNVVTPKGLTNATTVLSVWVNGWNFTRRDMTNYTYQAFESNPGIYWVPITETIVTPYPLADISIVGEVRSAKVSVELNFMVVTPVS